MGRRDHLAIRPFYRRSDCRAGFGDGEFSRFELSELRRQSSGSETVGFDEVPIALGGDGEARRHLDAVAPKIAHHLSKGGVLAADGRHVAGPYVLEPANVAGGCSCLHGVLDECQPRHCATSMILLRARFTRLVPSIIVGYRPGSRRIGDSSRVPSG